MSNYQKINATKTLSILALSALLSTTSYAQGAVESSGNIKIAIGAKVGTAGFGIEGRIPVTENLYGRLGVNYLHYNHSLNKGTLNYKGKLTFLTVPLMLDYHPFDDSGFRLSAGVAYNGNKVTANASPNKAITLYGHNYTKDELGKVKSKLTLGNKIAPIVSIGYDSSFINNNPWSFNAEAGIMYAGKAKVKVSATGISANQKQKIDDLNRDANKSLNKVKKYLKFFPIVSIGFKYTF